MHRELIVKVLVKLAFPASVVSIACLKIDTFFHVVNARAFPRRSFFEFFLPENNVTFFSFWGFALFLKVIVLVANAAQCPVKAAGCAMIINPAKPSANNTGLHPNAGASVVCHSILQLR